MPIAQSSPFLTYQTAQKKALKPLEQSYLEGWGQNYEVFGHNHKHYIWRGVNKAYDESTPSCLLWNTDVDHWCFGDVWATQAIGQNWWQGECSVFSENTGGKFALIRQEAAHGMHSDIPKWQWTKTQGQVDLSLVTAERSEVSGSGHLCLLTST